MLETLPNSVYRHEGVFDRSRLTVTYTLDTIEHRRRIAAQRREARHEFLLAALLSIPEGQLGKVSARFDQMIRNAGDLGLATVVEDLDGSLWAQRLARPAVTVQHIDITAETWRRGLDVAHRWAGYGTRTVHVAAADTFDLTEASHYGIGVATAKAQLLHPAPFIPQRWSSARWRFAEVVYGQYLDLAR